MVTGKPVEPGGSHGRAEATGRGVVIVMEQAVRDLGYEEPGEVTIAIQGFGNVGSWAASTAHDRGYRVVAIRDVHGGVTVSYVEWVQNNQEMRWEHDDVNHQLERKLTLREAAFALAVERVTDVARLRDYI